MNVCKNVETRTKKKILKFEQIIILWNPQLLFKFHFIHKIENISRPIKYSYFIHSNPDYDVGIDDVAIFFN